MPAHQLKRVANQQQVLLVLLRLVVDPQRVDEREVARFPGLAGVEGAARAAARNVEVVLQARHGVVGPHVKGVDLKRYAVLGLAAAQQLPNAAHSLVGGVVV